MTEKLRRQEQPQPVVSPEVVANRLAELHRLLRGGRLPSVTISVAPELLGEVPSWTQKSYTADVRNRRAVTIEAAYDPADPYRAQLLRARMGDVDWDYYRQPTPPTWANRAFRTLGIGL